MQIIQFVLANKVVLLTVCLSVSEAMALIPQFKSSGILDWVIRGIKTLLGK